MDRAEVTLQAVANCKLDEELNDEVVYFVTLCEGARLFHLAK